jgi:hypothetical protein
MTTKTKLTLTYDLHLTILLPIDEAGWVIQPQASLNEVQSLWRSLEGNQGHELLEGLRKSHMTKDQKGLMNYCQGRGGHEGDLHQEERPKGRHCSMERHMIELMDGQKRQFCETSGRALD